MRNVHTARWVIFRADPALLSLRSAHPSTWIIIILCCRALSVSLPCESRLGLYLFRQLSLPLMVKVARLFLDLGQPVPVLASRAIPRVHELELRIPFCQ